MTQMAIDDYAPTREWARQTLADMQAAEAPEVVKHFHADVHCPGYLPEGDVYTFDTANEAWDWVAEEIKRDWDRDAEGVGDDESLEAFFDIDDRYSPAHAVALRQRERGNVIVPGPTNTHLGWVYAVSECGVENCELAEEVE